MVTNHQLAGRDVSPSDLRIALDAYRQAVFGLATASERSPFTLDDLSIDPRLVAAPALLKAVVLGAFSAGSALRERGFGVRAEEITTAVIACLAVPDDRVDHIRAVVPAFLAPSPEATLSGVAGASRYGLDGYLYGMCALTVAAVRLVGQWDEVTPLDAVQDVLPGSLVG